MPGFFLSYRTADSGQFVGRLFDRLARHFGEDRIFLDFDKIAPGAELPTHLEETVRQCHALVAIVGPTWLDHLRKPPAPGAPPDYVALEIQTALATGVPIVPVMIGDTPVPKAADLPEALRELSLRSAARVDPGKDFDAHVVRLVRTLDAIAASAGLESTSILDRHILRDACQALVGFLRSECDHNGLEPSWNVEFKVAGAAEFLPGFIQTGVTVTLYRIVQTPGILMELHLLLTAWAYQAEVQHMIMGWVLERLRSHPVLPIEALQDTATGAIPAGMKIKVTPRNDDALTVWRSMTSDSYRLSMPFTLRASF